MPTKKPVRKYKPVKYDSNKYLKTERAVAKKWAKYIHEAAEWLDEIDFDDAPTKRDDSINDQLSTVYQMASSIRDMLTELPTLLPDWE